MKYGIITNEYWITKDEVINNEKQNLIGLSIINTGFTKVKFNEIIEFDPNPNGRILLKENYPVINDKYTLTFADTNATGNKVLVSVSRLVLKNQC